VSVNLTPAQAKKLGIDLSKGVPVPANKRRSYSHDGKYHTRCIDCGEEFSTAASEDRHVTESHHARYELILERNPE
jgi:hypothetical protein